MKPILRSLSICAFVCFTVLPQARADKIVLVAGDGTATDNAPATACRLNDPFGIAFDRSGTMFVVEMDLGQRLLKVSTGGMLTVVGGNGQKGDAGDGGPVSRATFAGMHTLVAAPNDDLFLADTWNNRIRRVSAKTGVITAFAGTGKKGFSGDGGPAIKAEFGSVINIALDPKGRNLYVVDIENRRVRVINIASGLVKTVAGNGEKGVPADGAVAAQSPLVDPRAVAVTARGEIYILERSGHALRKVDEHGNIVTVAGTGKAGLSGDGGDARLATMSGPKHVCLDRNGDVIFADTDNHVIRKYLPKENKIFRVAGTGKKGDGGVGGSPLEVELNQPHGVTVGPDGLLYIADSSNHRVLKIER